MSTAPRAPASPEGTSALPGTSPPLGSPRFHAALTLLALPVSAWIALGMPWLSFTPAPLAQRLTLLAVLVAAGWALRGRASRVADACFAVFWALLYGILYIPPMYAAARTDNPLVDPELATLDQHLGVTTTAFAWIQSEPGLGAASWLLYRSIFGVMALGLLLPLALRRPDRTRQYLIASILAGVIAIWLSGRWPAVGPWTVYPLPVDPNQAHVQTTIEALRAREALTLDVETLDGIIAIPSFHTILAVLGAWSVWPFKRVRWVATLWAAGVVYSTLATGWHFCVDVIGGLAFSAGCAALAGVVDRALHPAPSVG